MAGADGLPAHPLTRWHACCLSLQVRVQQQRAEEQRQAKAAADEEWRRAQREREMQRKADEEAREREAKVGWAGRRAA